MNKYIAALVLSAVATSAAYAYNCPQCAYVHQPKSFADGGYSSFAKAPKGDRKPFQPNAVYNERGEAFGQDPDINVRHNLLRDGLNYGR